jgi:hypothetical protein
VHSWALQAPAARAVTTKPVKADRVADSASAARLAAAAWRVRPVPAGTWVAQAAQAAEAVHDDDEIAVRFVRSLVRVDHRLLRELRVQSSARTTG